MHASLDVAACQPLQLFASLDEETACRNPDRNPLAVAQPHKQTREARFAMYCQKVEVIVVASIAHVESVVHLQVGTCVVIHHDCMGADGIATSCAA